MYESPLHIISDYSLDVAPAQLETANLLRLRKRLLAEFDLTDQPTLQINGRPYTKDEVIKQLDQLLDNPLSNMHLFIFKHKELLDFLENNESDVDTATLRNLKLPVDFSGRIKSLLFERLVFNLKKALVSKDFVSATDLVSGYDLLNDEDLPNFSEQVFKGLAMLHSQVETVHNGDVESMPTELSYLKKTDGLPVFLNSLPEELKQAVDTLVIEIVNCMVAYQKASNKDKNYLYCVSKVLMEVNCNPELTQLIRSNHKAFKHQFENDSVLSGNNSSFRMLYFVVILLVVVLRNVNTCSRSDRQSINYYPNAKIDNSISVITGGEYRQSVTNLGDFMAYRRFLIDSAGQLQSNYLKPGYMPVSGLQNGQSPFVHMMQHDPVPPGLTDSTSTMVGVKNSSGRHLLVFVFDDKNARARFFEKGHSDSLLLKQSDLLCLYFGDSLRIHRIQGKDELLTVFNPERQEVFFGWQDENTQRVLRNSYQLQLKQRGKGKNKPLLEFKPGFFKADSLNTKQLRLKPFLTTL